MEYALYKGEDILCIGTVEEIAKHQKVKKQTVLFYGTNSYKKRVKDNGKILILLDDEGI